MNSEFEVLYAFMEKLPAALAPGGRVAILTFHSGEDRIVKKAFKELKRAGITARSRRMSSVLQRRSVQGTAALVLLKCAGQSGQKNNSNDIQQ